METAARIQNDGTLWRYIRSHSVTLNSRRRLLGFSPELDEMMEPYPCSQADEAEVLRLLAPASRASVCCYRARHVLAALLGLAGAAGCYALLRE